MDSFTITTKHQYFFTPACSSLFLLLLLSFTGSVSAYKNYTVGDSLGWYDKLEKPNVDYRKWVVGKNFSLGDFLIFNTDNNHSVVQTYNVTTYKACDYDDALEEDTTQWSSADPSSTSPHPVSVPVPLLKVGLTYFFSGDYDGEQCQNGQNFEIKVTYGQGLPSSLRRPSGQEQAPSPDSAPDTLVPSYFDTPQNVSDDATTDDETSKAIPLSASSYFNGLLLILFGLLSII